MSTLMAKEPLLGGLDSHRKRSVQAPKRRMNPYAACVVQLRKDGKLFLYLNAGIQSGHHYYESQCPGCGHGYSELIDAPASAVCNECHGDHIAMRGIELERQGIRLGWGAHHADAVNIDYLREQYGKGRKKRLQQEAKEV